MELGSAMAKKLGVPVEFLPHLASGEIQNSAASGKWDVTFMPVDEERKNSSISGTLIICCKAHISSRPGQACKSRGRERVGVRIGGVADTATLGRQRTAPNATFVALPGVDAAVAAMKAGQIDCIALSRESLSGLAAKIPGSRILDGGFLDSSTAVALPKEAGRSLCQPVCRGSEVERTGTKSFRRNEPAECASGTSRDETLGGTCYRCAGRHSAPVWSVIWPMPPR